ncbi:MAG: GntR family transcriptional regulator [Anaerolineales bacterium]|nr:GntR family transcriptional regulator [Anaerolineales bacterium]MCB9146322.1 GntR family transcriptional regulator [Anaerolineales bacterium]
MIIDEIASHRQLRKLVADQLRAAILDGRFRPGEWMRQERLAQELKVSQMPVREALKELAAEGLIEHVPYRGARVVKYSIDDVQDLYEHRAFLEGRAAGIAAALMSKETLDELRGIQNEIDQHNAPEQVGVYRELNRQFHSLIYTASQRQYLIHTLTQMWAVFPTMLISNFPGTATMPLPHRDQTDSQEHVAILAALEERNPQAANEAMQRHILLTGSQLISFIRSQSISNDSRL